MRRVVQRRQLGRRDRWGDRWGDGGGLDGRGGHGRGNGGLGRGAQPGQQQAGPVRIGAAAGVLDHPDIEAARPQRLAKRLAAAGRLGRHQHLQHRAAPVVGTQAFADASHQVLVAAGAGQHQRGAGARQQIQRQAERAGILGRGLDLQHAQPGAFRRRQHGAAQQGQRGLGLALVQQHHFGQAGAGAVGQRLQAEARPAAVRIPGHQAVARHRGLAWEQAVERRGLRLRGPGAQFASHRHHTSTCWASMMR